MFSISRRRQRKGRKDGGKERQLSTGGGGGIRGRGRAAAAAAARARRGGARWLLGTERPATCDVGFKRPFAFVRSSVARNSLPVLLPDGA